MHPPAPTDPHPTPPPAGNAIGCAIGVFLLMNCGLWPQFSNAVNAISVAKISYPLKEVGGWVGLVGAWVVSCL